MREFFRRYLSVDWWVADGKLQTPDGGDVLVLAPAIKGHEGQRYPWWPTGQCVFLNAEGRCRIHEAKPYECRQALVCEKATTASDRKTMAERKRLVREWAAPKNQKAIRALEKKS